MKSISGAIPMLMLAAGLSQSVHANAPTVLADLCTLKTLVETGPSRVELLRLPLLDLADKYGGGFEGDVFSQREILRTARFAGERIVDELNDQLGPLAGCNFENMTWSTIPFLPDIEPVRKFVDNASPKDGSPSDQAKKMIALFSTSILIDLKNQSADIYQAIKDQIVITEAGKLRSELELLDDVKWLHEKFKRSYQAELLPDVWQFYEAGIAAILSNGFADWIEKGFPNVALPAVVPNLSGRTVRCGTSEAEGALEIKILDKVANEDFYRAQFDDGDEGFVVPKVQQGKWMMDIVQPVRAYPVGFIITLRVFFDAHNEALRTEIALPWDAVVGPLFCTML